MGIVLELKRPQVRRSSREASQVESPRRKACEIIVFPRVNIADLRDLWEAMRAELAEHRTAPRHP